MVAVLAALSVGALFLLRGDPYAQLPEIVLKHHAEGGYSWWVDDKPYLVQGVCYLPTPVGENVHYNFWGQPELWEQDGRLMQEMGVNTVRFYREGKNPEEVREVIDGLYRKNGIRSLMGHDLGFWDWPPPNYALAEFRKKVKKEVLRTVELYKDEPGILAWILGNENNYSFEVMNLRNWSTPELEAIEDLEERSRAKAKIYYSFVNEIAAEIKQLDPLRPVIMGVGEVGSLDVAAKLCPHVDILGLNVYRGAGFGNLFRQVRQRFDKPVLLIEWGVDSYNAKTKEEAQDIQAQFHKLQWREIQRNSFLRSAKGNCIGGTLFEWSDEWWKANEHVPDTWKTHDTTGQFSNAAYYYDYEHNLFNMNEEWWGVVSVLPKTGDQKSDGRKPKKSFHTLKELWTK